MRSLTVPVSFSSLDLPWRSPCAASPVAGRELEGKASRPVRRTQRYGCTDFSKAIPLRWRPATVTDAPLFILPRERQRERNATQLYITFGCCPTGVSRTPASTVGLSKVKCHLRGDGARRDVVRAAESGKEVVERVFVRHVDGGQAQADFVFVATKYVVVPEGDVEKISRCDSRRIVVIALTIWNGYLQQGRSELRYGTWVGQRLCGRRPLRSAEQAGFEFLIGTKGHSERVRHCYSRSARRSHRGLSAVPAVAGSLAGDHSAIVAPVEAEPGARLPGLVLKVRGQVEIFVVIDAKRN